MVLVNTDIFNIETNPNLLSQCNIPKPLHGLNPRNLMGKEAWDVYRRNVYASTNYHCKACGVHKMDAKKHQWLEAHEDFEIDYNKQVMKLRQIIPLCHYCHQFIHSGLLRRNYEAGRVDGHHVLNVLMHGFYILYENNLPCFGGTLDLGKDFDIDISPLDKIKTPNSIEWHGWKMVWDGVEYESKFRTYDEWYDFYNGDTIDV